MNELELNIKKGDLTITIRGSSKEEIIQKVEDALALLEDVAKKLTTKTIELPRAPTPTIEVPHISPPPTSCRDAIVKLLSTEWGKAAPRTLSEIIEAMKINAVYYPKARVASDLLALTRSGITRRLKTEAGFAYILAQPV